MQNEAIVVQRIYPVPAEKVWEAITNPEQMRQWYFPMLEDFKAEVGFETSFAVPAFDKHFLHIWKVAEVIPGKKISYEWRYGGYPGNSLVSFELFEEKEGTRLVLTHKNLETFKGDQYPELARENFILGWTRFICLALKEYMNKIAGPLGQTGMLIRKAAGEVFEAFADPAVTSKFWFTHSSGRLEEGKEVTWSWAMYDVQAKVLPQYIIPNYEIIAEWGAPGSDRTSIELKFQPIGNDATFVSIEMWGFKGDREKQLQLIADQVSGFCWVLAGLKAYLEHGIQLNLIADRYLK
jgi:uncharacterized protein YndB with AHSA1/START domain